MPRDACGLVVMEVTSHAMAAEPGASFLHHVAVDAEDGDGHSWGCLSRPCRRSRQAVHRTAPESFVDSTSPLIWPCSTTCNSIARVQIPLFHREKQDGKPIDPRSLPRRRRCTHLEASRATIVIRPEPRRTFQNLDSCHRNGRSTSPLAKNVLSASRPFGERQHIHENMTAKLASTILQV